MIDEVIIVEGKDDIAAVKAAVDAEVIATNGYRFDESFINRLKKLSHKKGIIILTDPDYAGNRIRERISKDIPNCKHAFIPENKAIKKDDIGVENASKEDIIEAITKARPTIIDKRQEFTRQDLIDNGLFGGEDSRRKRERLGELLSIGYWNSKQLLNRLNNFNISRQEFQAALEELKDSDK